MRNVINICSILTLVVFFSCKKDQLPYYVVFGNSKASLMDVVTFDPNMQIASSSNGGNKYYSIDIDKNGEHDIQFISFGQRWANTKSCGIASLNDSVEILVEVIQDSIYLTYNNQNPIINDQNVIWNSFSGFESFSDNDSLIGRRKEYCIRMFNHGDILDISDENLVWETKGEFASYSAGRSYHSEFYSLHKSGFWNNEGEKYLCYRIKNGTETKYGWIKASIEYNIIINVFEYSINK